MSDKNKRTAGASAVSTSIAISGGKPSEPKETPKTSDHKKRTGTDVAGTSAESRSIAVSGRKPSASKGFAEVRDKRKEEQFDCDDPNCKSGSDESLPERDVHKHDSDVGNLKWVPGYNGSIPEFAVIGRDDKHAPDMFVSRTKHGGELVPGELIPRDSCINVTECRCETKHKEYEVLTNPDHYEVSWLRRSKGDGIHECAVPGGYDKSGETYYIGRLMHKGHFALGKVRPSDHRCSISFEGKDYHYNEFELLLCSFKVRDMPIKGRWDCVDPECMSGSDERRNMPEMEFHKCDSAGRRSLRWVPGKNGSIPEFAIYGIDDRNKPDMIVGRGWHKKELVLGSVTPSNGCIHLFTQAMGTRHEQYEVLTNPDKCKLRWVPSKKEDGPDIHPRAVPVGYFKSGITTYVGRAERYKGDWLLGKVEPADHTITCTLNIDYVSNGMFYEVLICE